MKYNSPTSLDRLFLLLENCPNASIRAAAAHQLGELVSKVPDIDVLFDRLLILLSNRNWNSRLAGADAIRSIVSHLPTWIPQVSREPNSSTFDNESPDLLTLDGLNLVRLLSQGVRLYSMDARDLDYTDSSSSIKTGIKNEPVPSATLQELGNQLANVTTASDTSASDVTTKRLVVDPVASALVSHTNSSLDHLIDRQDLMAPTTADTSRQQMDVETCVRNSYKGNCDEDDQQSVKRPRLAVAVDSPNSQTNVLPTTYSDKWPLTRLVHLLLRQLWDARWQSRHGAACGLRELLTESRLTAQGGKRSGWTLEEMHRGHARFIEDIVVRTLCTLTLDQVSDFISDEVVAPVRETVAQLLGVISCHLTSNQVLAVANHLVELIDMFGREKKEDSRRVDGVGWMIVHGALLGVKYLLASRKDLENSLLQIVCQPLIELIISFNHHSLRHHTGVNSQPLKHTTTGSDVVTCCNDDLRAIAASVLVGLLQQQCRRRQDASPQGEHLIDLIGQSLGPCIWTVLGQITTNDNQHSDLTTSSTSITDGTLLELTACLVANHSRRHSSLDWCTLTQDRLTLFVRSILPALSLSSSVRQTSLSTLRRLLIVSCSSTNDKRELINLSVDLLQYILSSLYRCVLTEPVGQLRSLAAELFNDLVTLSPLPLLSDASIGCFDVWLCHAMQSIDLAFSPPLVGANLPSSVEHHSTDESNATPNCPPSSNAANNQPKSQPDLVEFIGGSHSSVSPHAPNHHAYVLETRITAVRLLALLACRLCTHSLPIVDSPTINARQASSSTTTFLVYLIDRLLCQTHLKDRLAIQRWVGGLLLTACLASNRLIALPEVEWLSSQLRSRLEQCLTEVVYYEEILVSFKMMQVDCRVLQQHLTESLPADARNSTAVTAVNNNQIMTIVDCNRLVQSAAEGDHQLTTSSNALGSVKDEPNASPSAVKKSQEGQALKQLIDKARSSVDRCLALQVSLASYVELTMASSLVLLDYIPSNRLTLLIRPLMDTIRCTSSNQSPSSSASPPPGSNSQLRSLAISCLGRLLMTLDGNRQHGKAIGKVVKNLTIALTNSYQTLCSSSSSTTLNNHGPSPNNSSIAVNSNSLTAIKVAKLDPSSDSPKSTRRPSQLAFPTSPLVESSSGDEEFVARYLGCSQALHHLFRLALQQSRDSVTDRRGVLLDALLHSMWTDPIERVLVMTGGKLSNASSPNYLQSLNESLLDCVGLKSTSSNDDHHQSAGQEDSSIVMTTSLLLLSACLPILLASSPPVNHPTSLSPANMIHFALLTVQLESASPSICLLFLTRLLELDPVELMNCLATWALKALTSSIHDQSPQCNLALTVLAGLINHLTLSSNNNLLLSTTAVSSIVDPNDPLGKQQVESPSIDLLPSLAPYGILFVAPCIRLLAGSPSPSIRQSAGQLFGLLLTLLPLETSLHDPCGMLPQLSQARRDQHQLIDSLLHPANIAAYNLPIKIRCELRGYQQEGVNWLNFLHQYGLNGILADDLGLGKTLQTLCILAGSHHNLQQEGSLLPSLVICPSTLCRHWLEEIDKFVSKDDLSPLLYTGSPLVRQGMQADLSNHNLIITSFDVVRTDAQFLNSIMWNYIILDEGHIIKSSKSKVSRAVKTLGSRHRLILTGTPIQNRVGELWSLFDFLMPDLLGSEAAFNSRFARHVANSRDTKASRADQQAGTLALERLHRLVLPFMLRRLKEDVMSDLPPKIVQDYACEMTPVQRKLYNQVLGDESASSPTDSLLESARFCFGSSTRPPGFFRTLHLLQAACNHPCLVLGKVEGRQGRLGRDLDVIGSTLIDDAPSSSGKLVALCHLLADCGFGHPLGHKSMSPGNSLETDEQLPCDEIVSQHRALLFFQSKAMLELTMSTVRSKFPWLTSLRLDGTVPVDQRQQVVTSFNQDPSIDLLFLTTTVGGLGLNLVGADTVIFVEHDWNPSRDLQAMDRAHRIGQKRTVNVYRLITLDSIEQQIMNLQSFKLHLANTVISSDNAHLVDMDTGRLFDRLSTDQQQSSTSAKPPTEDEEDDQLDASYRTEFALDKFLQRLSGPSSSETS